MIGVLAIVAIAVLLPYTPTASLPGFIPLALSLLGAIAISAVTYLLVVQAVKSWFYRRHALL
jgi:P-type Mg2+ transporter